ncbi:hypothetical protein D3C81_2295890 [compost metagenome]
MTTVTSITTTIVTDMSMVTVPDINTRQVSKLPKRMARSTTMVILMTMPPARMRRCV